MALRLKTPISLPPGNAVDVATELRRLYNLTPAETQLALRLARGERLREAAEEAQIAYETARARLKSIFAKTGTSRQTELALLISRLGNSAPRS